MPSQTRAKQATQKTIKRTHAKNGHKITSDKPAFLFIDLKPEQIVTRSDFTEELEALYTACDTIKAAAESIEMSPGHFGRVKNGCANPGPKFLRCFGMARQWQYYRQDSPWITHQCPY